MCRWTVYFGLALLFTCALAAGSGCNKAGQSKADTTAVEQSSVAPGCLASGKHCAKVQLAFSAAKSTGRQSNVADLEFTVDSDNAAPATMKISDPEKPKGAVSILDCCEFDLQPAMLEANVTSANGKECWAGTAYSFALKLPDGAQVAEFEITDSGILAIVPNSVKRPYDVQLISTRGRSIYMVFQVAEVTAKATPLFAFEWVKEAGYERHKIKAADGWQYEFRGHNGTLGVFHASCMGTLPEDLQLVALDEQVNRTNELKQWVKASQASGCYTGG